jgi:hypothetical protein
MCTRMAAYLAAVLACSPCGCGTIANLSDSRTAEVYGGIARDVSAVGRLFEDTPAGDAKAAARIGGVALAASYYALDLPLSLAADTLTLPITVPSTLTRQTRRDAQADAEGATDSAGKGDGYPTRPVIWADPLLAQ